MTDVIKLHVATFVPEGDRGPYIEMYLSDEHGHLSSKRFYKRNMPGFWAQLLRTSQVLDAASQAEARIQQRNIQAAKAPRPKPTKANANITLEDLL